MDSSLLDKAIIFATKAHAGVERKGKGFPYIVHPLEAVSIVATMSSDQHLLAAAALHDVVEDTEYTAEDIEREFGKEVAELVVLESDKEVSGVSRAASWHFRKQDSINRIKAYSIEGKMVAIGDKLSNMRAIARDYAEIGEKIWDRFHEKDPKEHEWRFRALADAFSDLKGTPAYEEFVSLIDKVFANK